MKTITLSDEFYAAAEKTVAQLRDTIQSLDEKRKSMEQLHYRLFKEPLPGLSAKKGRELCEHDQKSQCSIIENSN